MKTSRGRPSKVDQALIVDAIMKHAEALILPNRKILGKCDPVWNVISEELDNAISSTSLYTFVTCNRYGIRDKLVQPSPADLSNTSLPEQGLLENDTIPTDESNICDVTFEEMELETRSFSVFIPKSDFDDLVVDRLYKRSHRNKKKKYRHYKVLRPGNWQEIIASRIWDTTRLKCGFNFRNHYLTNDAKSGYINGTCNCGSKLRCTIEDSNVNDNNVELKCTVTRGLGTCGKRYLRAPIRQVVGKELVQKAVHVYRAEKADELMAPGDPEPPHLYAPAVLSMAKQEYMASQYLDRDPIKAIAIMRGRALKNIVHGVGLDPVYVHYWTNHQIQTFREFANSCVAIDATGSIVKKVEKANKEFSRHIFLYQCVVNCSVGQFSVSQMLTESHTTNSIQFWLMEWVRSGAPYPREVVADGSRALLTAVIRTFTGYSTMEEYADACKGTTLPKCYVRMDVAHFIKTYASFLKNAPRLVKIFCLAVLGKLIVTRTVDEARGIVKDLLLISRSETNGELACGRLSQCEQARLRLKSLITGVTVEIVDDTSHTSKSSHVRLQNLVEGVDIECNINEQSQTSAGSSDQRDNETNSENIETIVGGTRNEDHRDNKWSTWAAEIDEEVTAAVKEVGDRENAQYLPALAVRLKKDLKLLPLWSNVTRDSFGYGRVPASSAAVEGEFNKIKTHLLKHMTTPMRADVFLETHVNYINGRIKIAGAKTMSDNSIATNKDNLPEESLENISIVSSELNRAGFSVSPDSIVEPVLTSNRTIQETPMDEEMPGESSSCPACANNDESSGAHSCIICERFVHALDQCSVPYDNEDEGYGQRRVCIMCNRAQSLPQILATREVEDWGGLGEPEKKKRKPRYLGKNAHKIQDLLTFSKNKQLPILKNGGSIQLRSIKMGDIRVCLIHTCAFDSLVQLMLAATCDWPTLRESVQTLRYHNPLFAITIDLLEKGLRAHTYTLRAEILSQFVTIENESDSGIKILDCDTNIGSLAKNLLQETPSYVETATCNKGCRPRDQPIKVLDLERALLKDSKDFEKIIQNRQCLLKLRKCSTKNCTGSEKTDISLIADIVMFDVFGVEDDNFPIQLGKLPNHFENPIDPRSKYELLGLVHYVGPSVRTRLSDNSVAHYTAISKRRDGKWIEYNDLHENETPLNQSFKANPKLLVYTCKRG